jgi:integral membrane protein (TIGR00529 family)
MTADEKAFVNYWYRHPWELILPLYPGIVLASAISGVSLRDLIIYNLPIAIIFVIFGFIISMRNVKNEDSQDKKDIFKNIYSFIPICLVLVPVVIFKIDLYISLFLNILFLCLWFKVKMKKLFEIIRYGFTLDVVLLVVGVIIFEEMLKFSGAVDAVASEITHLGIEPIYVFIFLPLFVGLITGVSVGFVGSTFPLLLHLKETFPYEISLAFVAGYTGVMISPLHLCLILTRNYFKADMKGIYRKVIPGTFVMLFSALIEFAILRYYS